MIGVDLGLNVGSVIRVDKHGVVRDCLVLKFTDEKGLDEDERIRRIGLRFATVIMGMSNKSPIKQKIAIEEPVFSWGRKNPKGFAKNVALQTTVYNYLAKSKMKIIRVNNKTAKKAAGGGGKDKTAMIQAYVKATGKLPGHSTKYGQETLADSYFIARAAQEK